MERANGPAIGLFLIGTMMLAFGTLDLLSGEMDDVPFMVLSTIGLWMGAAVLRHQADVPGGPLFVVGLSIWALAQVGKFVFLLATPSIFLVPFGLLAVGSLLATVAAWRWYQALEDEEVARMLPVRVGLALFGAGLLGMFSLQVLANGLGLPSVLLLTGAVGSAVFAASFAAPATARAPGRADAA